MTPAEIEAMLEHLQARTVRIEQILPTLATKDDLRALTEHFELRFDRVETRLDGVETRLDAVETRLDAVDARFDAVDARFDAIDARFDAIDARFDAVDARFDGVGARMDTLEARINAVSRQALVLHEDLKSDVRLLAEHLARVLERLGP